MTPDGRCVTQGLSACALLAPSDEGAVPARARQPEEPTPVPITVAVEGADALRTYASISIAYRSAEVLDPDSPAAVGSLLPYSTRTLDAPIVKDYDTLPGNHPLDWPARFDVRGWGILVAHRGEHRVGGAVLMARCPELEMLEGREELALLWDLRVSPAERNRGVGTALLAAGESSVRARGACVLKVETQSTNVPACRFYARRGFLLRAARRGAYVAFPHEVRLLWYKHLD